ncbi:metallophosphoesterase [Propionivibrio sp.]|uniref:metallophosphoesterase n=1 Tax=Propionivibrio sp. TaxID=2212460 RepID=UPI003BF40809
MKRLLATLGLIIAFSAQAETWRFALIGDVPYSDHERRELPLMLDDIATEHLAFIVHAGDFKRSNAKCSDELFLDRHALFEASSVPFIYVPGDNEWTDCTRVITGHFSELERLGKLREIFFAEPLSQGKSKIPVEQQSAAYPEHLRWRLGTVLFLSLNVPGPDNNFGMSKEASPEFLARNPIVIDWLKQGFSTARREKSAGIVIVMQGNPGFKHFTIGFGHSGYLELLEILRNETLAFPGQVLLVHGDTHWQRIDHPLHHPETKEQISNFTRVETFGYPFMGWVKVIIDNEDPALFRFEVQPHKSR